MKSWISIYLRLGEITRPGYILRIVTVYAALLLGSTWAFTDPSQFEAVGIDPLAHKIVVVKEGYLFQGLRDIAPRTIMALTPGFAYQLVENLPYQNLRRPVYPIDPEMEWSASQ